MQEATQVYQDLGTAFLSVTLETSTGIPNSEKKLPWHYVTGGKLNLATTDHLCQCKVKNLEKYIASHQVNWHWEQLKPAHLCPDGKPEQHQPSGLAPMRLNEVCWSL